MNQFTVIGYFDTGERYCGHHNGETWTDAVQDAIQGCELSRDLNIVEVLEGFHNGLTEGQYVEAACDFPMAEEADEEAIS